jgi:excinuclease ABC subunit A
VNGVVQEIEAVQALARYKKHTIEAVVDRLKIAGGSRRFKKRLTDSVETALKLGEGRIIVHRMDERRHPHERGPFLLRHRLSGTGPTLFSFNSPLGMCPDCNGIGSKLAMDADKVIADAKLTIRQGAVIPWQGHFYRQRQAQRLLDGRAIEGHGRTVGVGS